MIKPEQIPDEAVDAGAKAMISSSSSLVWDDMPGFHDLWRKEARDTIAAALNAWPGIVFDEGARVTEGYNDPGSITLPIPAGRR